MFHAFSNIKLKGLFFPGNFLYSGTWKNSQKIKSQNGRTSLLEIFYFKEFFGGYCVARGISEFVPFSAEHGFASYWLILGTMPTIDFYLWSNWCGFSHILTENSATRHSANTRLLFSISTFNCGFICEHLLFVQYKTTTKKVREYNNTFSWIFKNF